MRIAVIGSRSLRDCNISEYLPENTTEIVSGGAKGVDTCAALYASDAGIKLTEFLPDYEKYGRFAPLKRNIDIVSYSDEIIAFWNGKSRGTSFVIKEAEKQGKKVRIVYVNDESL